MLHFLFFSFLLHFLRGRKGAHFPLAKTRRRDFFPSTFALSLVHKRRPFSNKIGPFRKYARCDQLKLNWIFVLRLRFTLTTTLTLTILPLLSLFVVELQVQGPCSPRHGLHQDDGGEEDPRGHSRQPQGGSRRGSPRMQELRRKSATPTVPYFPLFIPRSNAVVVFCFCIVNALSNINTRRHVKQGAATVTFI